MINLLLPLLAFGLVQNPCDTACRADINDDGVVSMKDLQLFLSFYDGVIDDNTQRIDMNCDGLENITDYTIFLSQYGNTVPNNCK